MKKSLIYFLRNLQDPYLLSQLLEIKNESDDVIKEEIEEAYGLDCNIEKIFKHFKQLPLDINIDIIGLDNNEDDEWDITPDFEVKQQLIVKCCDGDSYLINLPIKI